MKYITINNVLYKISCNALTYLYHKKIFDKNIFEDINEVREFLIMKTNFNKEKQTQNIIKNLNSYINAITRLAYSSIFTQNKDIEEYDEWIKKNQIFEQDDDCVAIIIEDVIDCFIDEIVSKELEKINKGSGDDTEVLFPEHYFLSATFKLGLTIDDLEKLTYVDVIKIFLSSTQKKKAKVRKATQADWDKLAGRS